MIGPGASMLVYLACGVTDMRKGIDGLMALVQSSLRQKPASGWVFAFRGRRGDRIKLLFWDGQGFCLYYKVLEKGRFPWPSATDGKGAADGRTIGDVVRRDRLATSIMDVCADTRCRRSTRGPQTSTVRRIVGED
ncbi:IS66 family insertion sequence element accessory protein TnpB [Rhizobium binae]|uniref:IS66 family insertion sequence element accessory protein TnpB n=1 Tax=Rhizobium binae TaxID=1138190 RepID=UPI0035C8F1BE